MPGSDIIYDKFNWHFGVVEDRYDPLEIGRVRVRFYGVHSSDKSKVPTAALPWATPVNPVFNASVSGVGGPHTGLVEGSWVIGFFIDQDSYQKPFILGTIAGIPVDPANPDAGFNDPAGIYPRNAQENYNDLGESDISRLARGSLNAEKHDSLVTRRENKILDIPIAKAEKVISVQEPKADSYYERRFFEEPDPTGYTATKSAYPHNKVHETETGHVFEIDDTPNHGRIHNYHNSGTYEEIVADGTKTTKVVGDGFDITVRDRNVYIGGSCNITIIGNTNLLVKGDMTTEVDGNYFLTVRKDKVEKIQGNHITEILSDRNTQINGNNAIRIAGNDITNIIGNESISIGGSKNETIVGNSTLTIISNFSGTVIQNYTLVVGGSGDLGTAGTFSVASADTMALKSVSNMTIVTDANQTITVAGTQDSTASVTNINNDVNITGTSTASVDHVSAGISGATHVHTEQGDGADVSAPK